MPEKILFAIIKVPQNKVCEGRVQNLGKLRLGQRIDDSYKLTPSIRCPLFK